MSDFPQVANIKVGDNIYDLKDNLGRAKYNIEKQKTITADNVLLSNKTVLAEAITNKGIATSHEDTLMQFAENISKIKLGDNPAKGVLELITCSSYKVSYSVAYNYPIVTRTGGGEYYTNQSAGSGGYKYSLENGNPNLKDAIVITRHKIDEIPTNGFQGNIPVIFFNIFAPIDLSMTHLDCTNNRIGYKMNGGEVRYLTFPATETFTIQDFYLKCEISMISDTQLKIRFYVSQPNVDGDPTEWIYVQEDFADVSEPSTDLYISVLGAGVEWYTKNVLIADRLWSDDSSAEKHFYGNYINETCIAVKDDADIYKVVLGASSIYPY